MKPTLAIVLAVDIWKLLKFIFFLKFSEVPVYHNKHALLI